MRRQGIAASFEENELRALLLAGDLVTAGLAALVAPAVWAAFDPSFAPRTDLRPFEGIFLVVWVVLLRILGGGDLKAPRFGRRTLAVVWRTTLVATALVLAMFFIAPFFAPRGATFATLPLAAAATLIWRYVYLRGIQMRTLGRRVGIVGLDDASRRAAVAIARWDGAIRYDIVAFLGDGSAAAAATAPVIEVGADPWSTIMELGIDLLVVGHTRSVPAPLLAELTRCFEFGVEATPATVLYEQLTGRVLAPALEADWYAELPTHARGIYTIAKRCIDIAAGLLGGAFALILTPFIVLAILIDSRGPVLHRQIRVGLRGEPFVVHKFRTMRPDAERDGRPRWSAPDDDRVTRVGRVLRRTRLDELPQLWDVLRGKMSLIGPRPERPEFVEDLARELPLYRARSLVRPGITGWAQVQYPYAETVEKNLAKLEYDLYYVRHLSFLLDLAIVLRTLPVMVLPRRHAETE